MCADMHQRVHASLAQPQVERHIAMARAAGQVVIVAVAMGAFAAFGLQGYQRVADGQRGKTERAIGGGSIGFRLAPCGEKFSAQGIGQCCQSLAVLCHRPVLMCALKERCQSGLRVSGISRLGQIGQDRLGRSQRIQPTAWAIWYVLPG